MDTRRFLAALLLLTFGSAAVAAASTLALWALAPALLAAAAWTATRHRS